MRTEWQNQKKEFVAKMNCSGPPGKLERGSVGWFEVAPFDDWRFDWKLKIQCSVTVPKPGYGYGRPTGWRLRSRAEASEFHPMSGDYGTFIIEKDIVEIVFSIPDCIRPFQKRGWGCALGGPILIKEALYHCAARLEAKGPPDGSLKRNENGIDFLIARNGRTEVIGSLSNHVRRLTIEELRAAFLKPPSVSENG